MYCNKVSYNYLYNFEDMVVVKLIDKNLFHISQPIKRASGEDNIDFFRGSSKLLRSTVLSTLVALVTADHHVLPSEYPSTKNLPGKALATIDVEQYARLPPDLKPHDCEDQDQDEDTLFGSGDQSGESDSGAMRFASYFEVRARCRFE